MKNTFFAIVFLLFSGTVSAQKPVFSYRVQGGPDTFYLVKQETRVFPDGQIITEEVKRPVIGRDSLKSYLNALETKAVRDEQNADTEKTERTRTKLEIRKIRRELERIDSTGRSGSVKPAQYHFFDTSFKVESSNKNIALCRDATAETIGFVTIDNVKYRTFPPGDVAHETERILSYENTRLKIADQAAEQKPKKKSRPKIRFRK